ncbi:MAG: ATP-binding protein [bacterium]
MIKGKEPIKLQIPSKLGFEKIAAGCAVSIATDMNFFPSKIDDLKTAVTEACLNAIEHGNKMNQNVHVVITMTPCEEAMVVEVWDNGGERYDYQSDPDIKQKINGENRPRGWGLFLIQNLMDEVEIKYVPKKGNVIRMVMYLKPPASSFQ